jgi:hypothetical protein
MICTFLSMSQPTGVVRSYNKFHRLPPGRYSAHRRLRWSLTCICIKAEKSTVVQYDIIRIDIANISALTRPLTKLRNEEIEYPQEGKLECIKIEGSKT